MYRLPADARAPSPALGRRTDGRACWGRERNRSVLVDALAVIGAALGSGAVQLSVAGMGNDPRLRGVGGRADPGPAGRFRDRCRLGPLHPVARDLTPPTPGGPSAAARVVPPSGLRRVLRKEANRQLSAVSGPSPRRGNRTSTPAL